MRKQQAVICTILFAIVIVIVLTTSFYIKNDEYGISLYQLIMNMIANSWLGCSVGRFYKWLLKE